MSLTAKDVEQIMALLESSRFGRLSLEMEGLKLELARNGAAKSNVSPAPAPSPAPSPPPEPGSPARRDGVVEVTSPLLGIFYRAPKPGEPAFVEVGARVEEESVIGIIEVMKLMNSARAGVRGEIVEILVPNGELVEHGQPLMLVRPES
jgi:acetyl-CoA carboxylase biotin carboxyl carrier protein